MNYLEEAKVIFTNVVVTFIQAGMATWLVSNFALDKATLGAVIGAGASAVWNVVVKPQLKKWGVMKQTLPNAGA